MTAYFDKINKWQRDQRPQDMTPEERLALVDRVERAVTWDLYCTMDFEFPEDLREWAVTLITRYPIAPHPIWCREDSLGLTMNPHGRRWAKKHDDLADLPFERDRLERVEAVEEGLMFVACFVEKVHSLMHEVAARRIETRWGMFSDSLDQNLKDMDRFLEGGGKSYQLFPHEQIHDHPLRGEIMHTAPNFGRDTALVKLGIESRD